MSHVSLRDEIAHAILGGTQDSSSPEQYVQSALPVSRTSTLVEHGGVVGKWKIQLSQQVSVSELAHTTGFLQRQNSVVMP